MRLLVGIQTGITIWDCQTEFMEARLPPPRELGVERLSSDVDWEQKLNSFGSLELWQAGTLGGVWGYGLDVKKCVSVCSFKFL